jgi:acetyl-CoA/propionyl-CoA carboxylase biotin carboxyl carrier protein
MKKVLIANRGEIAVRIIRACRDYGLQSVAVYADPDQDALFVRLADEAYALEGVRPAETYLDIAKLIAIAKRAGADAVHPGYGFLSERAEFAQAVIDAGLSWIGPDPHVIEALGDKVEARRIATGVGAPLVAGSDGPVSTAAEVTAFAEEHGLPVAIKAAHGGGGRGLKVAWKMEEIADLYESAVREATAAFGRGECFLERFLDRPRHIEAQVLADKHGNVLVLGTRDCSLQRRNQKLIEEAPAPFLSAEQRQKIHDAAKAICAAAGYSGAGTVEFLLGVDGTISWRSIRACRWNIPSPRKPPASISSSSSSVLPKAISCGCLKRRNRAATRWNSALMPKIPAGASCPHRVRSRFSTRLPVPAFASIAALSAAPACRVCSTR